MHTTEQSVVSQFEMLSGELRKGGRMFGAKIVIWTGVIIALFGSSILARVSYAVGIRPFPDDETNTLAITLGLCLVVGGLVAYFYEKDKFQTETLPNNR